LNPIHSRGAARGLAALAVALSAAAVPAEAASILFIGNSFTFGEESPVHFYRADTVTDLDGGGVGGMPALFKSFATQAGRDYDVYVEAEPGTGIDWHVERKSGVIGQRPWDVAVMQSFSMLSADKPGDPAALVDAVRRMSALLRARNPAVDIRLMATWPRADQLYPPDGLWRGQSADAMARDLRAGYDLAAAGTPGLKPPIPVGEAWARAIRTGVADANPYDGIDRGKMGLWAYDDYHASSFGYYLEALVVFGSVTGLDPRSLGENECSGYELGMSTAQVAALEQVAFDELAAAGAVRPAPLKLVKPGEPGGPGGPVRCVRPR
jgi:hypothetical protein